MYIQRLIRASYILHWQQISGLVSCLGITVELALVAKEKVRYSRGPEYRRAGLATHLPCSGSLSSLACGRAFAKVMRAISAPGVRVRPAPHLTSTGELILLVDL